MIIASSIGRLAGLSPLIPKNCVGLIMNSDKRTARGGNEERGSGHGGQDPKIPSTAETKADPVSAGENKALCVEALSKSGFQCHFVTDTERSAMDEICAHVVELQTTLVVADAFYHPLVRRSVAVTQNGLGAFLGAPVRDADDKVVAVVYLQKIRMHNWSDEELQAVEAAAYRLGQAMQITAGGATVTPRS